MVVALVGICIILNTQIKYQTEMDREPEQGVGLSAQSQEDAVPEAEVTLTVGLSWL